MYEAIRRTVAIAVCVALGLAPRSLWAGPKEEARKHYDRAIELVDDNQLLEAVVEFQRSYDLTKHFSVLYNIGQVYVSLAKPVEAIAAYEGYLASGGKNVPAGRRIEVEKEIAKQKTRIATLTIVTIPDGATIKLDGTVIGTSPLTRPVTMKIGEHVLSASAENYESEEVKVTLAGEDRRTVQMSLKAKGEKKAESIASVVVVPPAVPWAPAASIGSSITQPLVTSEVEPAKTERSLSSLQTIGIASGIVGVVAAGAATTFWILANSKHDEAASLWNNQTDDQKANDLQGQAKNYGQYGNISIIAGGSLIALGALLYLIGGEEESAAQAHVLPNVGKDFAGITAGGTW